MNNIGDIDIPIKCSDPMQVFRICIGALPHPVTGLCHFEIKGWCGADLKDFEKGDKDNG